MVRSTDDEHEESDDLPATITHKSKSLEEIRRIRREQDEAYALSLQADQLKVVCRSASVALLIIL